VNSIQSIVRTLPAACIRLLACSAVCASAWASPSDQSERPAPDSALTLVDVLDYAHAFAPSVRAADAAYESQRETAGHIGAWPDPVLSYVYFVEPIQTRVGPQRQRFSLKQTVPWFGTTGARKESARAKAQALQEGVRATWLGVSLSVRRAYATYYYLVREISLTRESADLLRLWESVVRSRYRASLASHPDVMRTEIELARLTDRLRALEDRLDVAAERVRAEAGLSADQPLADPVLPATQSLNWPRDSLIVWARAVSPDLVAGRFELESRDASVRVATRSSVPNLTLGVDYYDIGTPDQPVPSGGTDAWAVGVSLNLPLWIGKNGSRNDDARADYRRSEYELEDMQRQLEASIHEAVFEYTDALARLRLYRDALVPKASQSLGATYSAYQGGQANFLDLLQSQRELLALQLEEQRAHVDAFVGLARTEALVGRDLHTTESGDQHAN